MRGHNNSSPNFASFSSNYYVIAFQADRGRKFTKISGGDGGIFGSLPLFVMSDL